MEQLVGLVPACFNTTSDLENGGLEINTATKVYESFNVLASATHTETHVGTMPWKRCLSTPCIRRHTRRCRIARYYGH